MTAIRSDLYRAQSWVSSVRVQRESACHPREHSVAVGGTTDAPDWPAPPDAPPVAALPGPLSVPPSGWRVGAPGVFKVPDWESAGAVRARWRVPVESAGMPAPGRVPVGLPAPVPGVVAPGAAVAAPVLPEVPPEAAPPPPPPPPCAQVPPAPRATTTIAARILLCILASPAGFLANGPTARRFPLAKRSARLPHCLDGFAVRML